MKKKIGLISLAAITILCSCSVENDEVEIDSYVKYDSSLTDTRLLDAIEKVEDSNVILVNKFSKAPMFGIQTNVSYDLKSAVVYKNESNKYYCVTEYSQDDEDASHYIMLGTDYENVILSSLLGYDEINNIAVYTFESDETIGVSDISETYDSSIGEEIFSIATLGGTTNSLSSFDYNTNAYDLYTGIISFTNGFNIMHGAMSSEDNKGSAVYDYDGNLLGLNVYKISTQIEVGSKYSETSQLGTLDTSDMNIAIRCDVLNTIVNQIEEDNVVERPNLGFDIVALRKTYSDYKDIVFYEAYLQEYAYINGLDEQPYYQYSKNNSNVKFVFPSGVKSGLLVSYDNPNKGSFTSLQSNDFIVGINDTTIYTLQEFLNIFLLTRVNDNVTLDVYRNNELITLTKKTGK